MPPPLAHLKRREARVRRCTGHWLVVLVLLCFAPMAQAQDAPPDTTAADTTVADTTAADTTEASGRPVLPDAPPVAAADTLFSSPEIAPAPSREADRSR
ncbi:MAG: hypothetical protein GVY15_09225, partial [Bacteroidetes bacterium]|nr:hypothetical protein [Bacteroidota bacterium]